MTPSSTGTYVQSASRRTHSKRSLSTGEGEIEARRSPTYARLKSALTDEALRLSLDLAEEAIAVDPHHRHLRREIAGVVYDLGEPGVMVAFRVEGGIVVFLAFADLGSR